MANGAVILKPMVDVERTYSANEAGISASQLVRFRGDLVETYGGWEQYISGSIGSTVRDLHAWLSAAESLYLGVGATSNLVTITSGSAADITPQTLTTNPTPSFSISSGSFAVSVADPDSGPTIFNTVFFNTPVSIGNLFLNGAYPIASVLSTGSYTIISSVAATTTIASSGILPMFSASSGSAIISIDAPNNNFQMIAGQQISLIAPTSVGGLTIEGPYSINSIVNSTTFTIVANTQASTTQSSVPMNGGLAQLVYYITIGPTQLGSGFGAGGFGLGGFGGGGTGFTGATGDPITATDWSQDNWGEILLSCPEDGPIYAWGPQSGYANAQVVATAPFFNGGIFISMPQQILVAWRSTQSTGTQDNLIVRWSDDGDYTNWEVSNETSAGSFKIPTGSIIRGGLQAANYGVIWTDIDAWTMTYVGGDVIFNFTKVGTGCGLIGSHACGVLGGFIYWCGTKNLFRLGPSGVETIPCSVWDFLFQNLNTDYAWKIRCAPNSSFNEITWFFPGTGATENNSYIKLNIVSGNWDYGLLPRTAWTDVSVLGEPIGSDTAGFLYQHETGESQSGVSATSFRSGWWTIAEGQDLVFVDYVIPDFIWGPYSEAKDASVNITFYAVDYPGAEPTAYGPYTVTQQTEYLNVRIRGRLMSVFVQSQTQSFWRLGRIRYRWSGSGRR